MLMLHCFNTACGLIESGVHRCSTHRGEEFKGGQTFQSYLPKTAVLPAKKILHNLLPATHSPTTFPPFLSLSLPSHAGFWSGIPSLCSRLQYVWPCCTPGSH